MNVGLARPPFLGATSRGLHIGGSELLVEFFGEALRIQASHVLIVTAFAETSGLRDDAVRPLWLRLVAAADVTVAVRTRTAAAAVAASIPSHGSISIRIDPRLHAKVFVAWRGTTSIALVGSQNLTAAGLHSNREAGVLIRPGNAGELEHVVDSLRLIAERSIRLGTTYDERRIR